MSDSSELGPEDAFIASLPGVVSKLLSTAWDQLDQKHSQAHAECFIANFFKTKFRIEI